MFSSAARMVPIADWRSYLWAERKSGKREGGELGLRRGDEPSKLGDGDHLHVHGDDLKGSTERSTAKAEQMSATWKVAGGRAG